MEMKSCCRLRISQRWSLVKWVTKLDFLLVVILFQGLSQDVRALTMNKISDKSSIKNGSAPIVLDCDYSYDPDVDTTGLVLKWYYNSSSTIVYQWIPPGLPQAQGILSNRLDLSHRITNDSYTQHRALRILQPTLELAGTYKCQVSAASGEVEANRELIVYVPADRVDMNYTKPTETSVNVSCHVDAMYPKPDAMMLIYSEKLDQNPMIVEAEENAEKINGKGGLFAANLHSVFEDSSLFHETYFECVFAIPNANYEIRQRMMYRPDPRSIKDGNDGIMTRSHFLYGLAAVVVSSTISRFLVQLS